MTFRMDKDVKMQMAAICSELGMSTSTAFNRFANAFVRAKGMPFQVTLAEKRTAPTRVQMLTDAEELLSAFEEDYRRMAE